MIEKDIVANITVEEYNCLDILDLTLDASQNITPQVIETINVFNSSNFLVKHS
jgi:hypothetical protein